MWDFLSGLGDYFGDLPDITGIISFLEYLWAVLQALAQFLWDVLVAIANFFWNILKGVYSFLKHLWENFFKPILSKIRGLFSTLHHWLELHLRPIIDFLKKVHAYLVRYYNTYLRPMLLMIQHIRQYLVILSFLHIHVAQKLDAWLAQLQAKIVQSFATMVAVVNTLIDISNALVDPGYLLRHPVLLISIRRQIPALIHAVTGRPPGYWFPSPRGSSGGVWAPVPFNFNPADPAQNAPTSAYISTDDGIGDLSGYMDGFEFLDGAVDQVDVLDYFNDELYPQSKCPYDDPAKCLLYSWGVTNV